MRPLLALAVLVAPFAWAQEPAPVVVRGVAWDSLRGAPLAGAFIAIAGTSRATTSDARGRFRFDSVVPGTYTFTMQHDVLDSIGFTGRSVRAVIGPAGGSVSIAIPSFAVLWRSACGAAVPLKDSAFVYGTVRDAAGQPASNARVGVNWLDLSYERRTGVEQQSWGGEVHTDSAGRYALCGVPADVGLQLRVVGDSGVRAVVELAPRTLRVGRRDFLLSPPRDSAVVRHGTVVGMLIGEGGRPIEGAIVATADVAEVRSVGDGSFVLRNVPAGTRQIEVRAIGASPVATVVDVVAGDTVRMSVELRRVQTLAEVKVTARTSRLVMIRGIEERRITGLGYFRDSLTIAQAPFVAAVFDGVAGLRISRGSGTGFTLSSARPGCARRPMAIWIDRVRLSTAELSGYRTDDIAVIEIYPGGLTAPPEFMTRVGGTLTCGAVVVWTKHFLRS